MKCQAALKKTKMSPDELQKEVIRLREVLDGLLPVHLRQADMITGMRDDSDRIAATIFDVKEETKVCLNSFEEKLDTMEERVKAWHESYKVKEDRLRRDFKMSPKYVKR